jgi:glycosyltransferase involved in cell wall biosynthesis
MRILQVHNRYQHAGGEDAVVKAEGELLEANAHQVSLFEVANEGIRGFWKKFSVALNSAYSQKSKVLVGRAISDFKPEVVHVHNFFPLITPSVYDACGDAGIPVVQTLHNYRAICPGALLMRDGQVCEDCIHGSAYRSVLHACYRGSALGTMVVASMVESHRKRNTWQEKVDTFIALTDFAKSKFVEAGFPKEKIIVKPNFYDGEFEDSITGDREGALFVGRLSREKGLYTLIEAWQGLNIPLRVIGDGPLFDEVKGRDLSSVIFLGRKSREEVIKEMGRAKFLVMPSECYEGFPMVIAEAFAAGLPVITTRFGSMAEIVSDGVTGSLFEAGDAEDLVAKVRSAFANPEEIEQMGKNARSVYEEKYTPETNYLQLMDIYGEAIERAKDRAKGRADNA